MSTKIVIGSVVMSKQGRDQNNLYLCVEVLDDQFVLIADGKTHQLRASMQIGSKAGMCTLDQCLFEKYKLGLLEYDTALSYMTDSSIITQIKQHHDMLEAQKLQAEMADKGHKK